LPAAASGFAFFSLLPASAGCFCPFSHSFLGDLLLFHAYFGGGGCRCDGAVLLFFRICWGCFLLFFALFRFAF
jgi:hypothetical protein